METKIRIGIDVGGTHTKAVAIDNNTHEILGKASVKTTHDAKVGVAEGVFQAFEKCLEENKLQAADVIFIAHSTTQATNALLEGDIANVGLISSARKGFETPLIKQQSKIKKIPLSESKDIQVTSTFISEKNFSKDKITSDIIKMKESGAAVIVASSAYGVDDTSFESYVSQIAQENGLYASCASEISKMYGFSRRTKTAIINASIMPKMLETMAQTESKLKEMSVEVPLMIMRGDGGIMDVSEVRKRPVLTMLSGPAASVMGSMMYLQASNGLYFEVGGTSTNIGVIKNGRPTIDYAKVGTLDTYVSSLDVKVLGVGGGSMVRAHKGKLVDIGPRSAHIAALPYASFMKPEDIINPKLKFFRPKDNDPQDYVAISLKNGKTITITTTCAANALGIISKEHFAYGSQKAAIKAMQPLAEYCNCSVETVALQILDQAFMKIEKIINMFINKYQLESENMKLVGVGGGAASLIIHSAKKLGLEWDIPQNAEVISSIGVALATVQDIVERVIVNPSKEDLKNIREEVLNKAIQSGATKESIQIHIDIDAQTQKVSAIATGSTEVRTQDTSKTYTVDELKSLAEKELKGEVKLHDHTDNYFIYQKENQMIVLDRKGFNRLAMHDASVKKVKVQNYKESIKAMWEEKSIYSADIILRPNFYICTHNTMNDFNADNLDQALILMDLELSSQTEDIIIIAMN